MDIKFLDCTIRDGGYTNLWDFENECVQSLIETLDKCGYHYVEVGFRNRPEIYNNKICNKWRYCSENILAGILPADKNRNIKISVMADYASSDISLFKKCEESYIDMVRVAFHKNHLDGALEFCGQLKKLGYVVCANAMATMNYDDNELKKLCQLSVKNQIDYLYAADSYGCLSEEDLENIFNHMKKGLENSSVKLGYHAHNNLQNALPNALYLIKNDMVDILDSTIFGMGRGSGNLCTELMVEKFFKDEDLLSICQFAEKYILPHFGNTMWGHKLEFIISAHFKCHPNYVLKLKDFDIKDVKRIWYFMTTIKKLGKNKYFDLNFLQKIVSEHFAEEYSE